MELMEYIQIIKKNLSLFLLVVLLVIGVCFAVLLSRPVSYTTSLLLGITRDGSQNTADYKFDDFYRIQADEKFAETIVQWMSNPGIASDIFSGAGIHTGNFSLRQLAKSFKAEKLSSQAVAVSFSSPTADQAQKIASSISETLSRNSAALNKDQKEDGWFKVIAHDPVVLRDIYNPFVVFAVALLAGIFLAFWVVLIMHYLKK